LGDESIFTFTRGCADFRDPTAVFRLKRAKMSERDGKLLVTLEQSGHRRFG
jgi:hypothetical protein